MMYELLPCTANAPLPSASASASSSSSSNGLNPHSKPFAPRSGSGSGSGSGSSSFLFSSSAGSSRNSTGSTSSSLGSSSFSLSPPFQDSTSPTYPPPPPPPSGGDPRLRHQLQQQQQQLEDSGVGSGSSSSSSEHAAKNLSYSSSSDSSASCSPTYLCGDDFGLRGLARSLEHSHRPNRGQPGYPNAAGTSAAAAPGRGRNNVGGMGSNFDFSTQDLGFTDEILQDPAPLHTRLETVLNNPGLKSSMSQYEGPEEYRNLMERNPKLPTPGFLLSQCPTDLLFTLFYISVGDAMQLLAGSMLFKRGWRYNKVHGIWIARAPNQPPEFRTSHLEKGFFLYFDPRTWERITTNITLYYEELAPHIEPPQDLMNLLRC